MGGREQHDVLRCAWGKREVRGRARCEPDERARGSSHAIATADDALRLSAEGLRLIVDTIPGLVTVHSADGTLELVNHRVLDYFGRTFEELKNWATSDAVHPDDRLETVAAWNRSMETGTPFVFEHRLRRRDGTHRWFQSRGHPLRDAEGRVMRWYSLFTDIDDLKHAQMKLRQDEAELRQIADYSPDAIIVFSADGRLLYANRFSLAYSGLSVEDFRDGGWRERIYHPDDIEDFENAKTKGLALGAPFEIELRILRADGNYRWSRIRYNPLLDDDGERDAMVRDAYRYRRPQASRRADEERKPGAARRNQQRFHVRRDCRSLKGNQDGGARGGPGRTHRFHCAHHW